MTAPRCTRPGATGPMHPPELYIEAAFALAISSAGHFATKGRRVATIRAEACGYDDTARQKLGLEPLTGRQDHPRNRYFRKLATFAERNRQEPRS